MRTVAALLAVILLAMAALILSSCGSHELFRSGSSSYLNGGFELTDDGYPVNWAFGPNPKTTDSFSVFLDTEVHIAGTQSLRIESSAASATKVIRSQRIPVSGGTTYRVAFSAMTEGCTLRVRRTVMDSSGTTNMRADEIAVPKGTVEGWQYFGEALAIAPGEAKVFLTFLVDGVGTLWCDAVTIEEELSS